MNKNDEIEFKNYKKENANKVPVYEFKDIFTLSFRYFLIDPFKRFIRKLRIKSYKYKSIQIEKQSGEKTYEIYFKIIINDDNPKLSVTVFRMEVPAYAAIIAKMKLRESIKKKIDVEIIKIDSIDE